MEWLVTHGVGSQTKPDQACHTVLFARSNRSGDQHRFRLRCSRRTACRSGCLCYCRMSCGNVFRWIEVNYGLFQAFGIIGVLLLVAAGICVVVALFSLRRSQPQFPSLASRLRVAIKRNPIHASQTQIAGDTASAVRSPTLEKVRIRRGSRLQRDDLQISASLILVATLLGWAAARRWQQTRRIQPKTAAPNHR
jgi:hypothetical protein